MFDTLEQANLRELHLFQDEATQLRALIATDSTNLGPALGGCRFKHYSSLNDAVWDAARLAKGMSRKAALAHLALGGGKSVILQPAQPFDRTALFYAFGQAVDSLKGRYITSVDSGSTSDDLLKIREKTRHVVGTHLDGGNPSPLTALGVFLGIQAAATYRWGNPSLKNKIILVQGLGQVGQGLVKHLLEAQARLYVSDISPQAHQWALDNQLEWIEPHAVLETPCDILSPCALGGFLTDQTNYHCEIIAGAANNVLANTQAAYNIDQQGILYAPDYVINAGGLIQVAAFYLNPNQNPDKLHQDVKNQIAKIPDRLTSIFEKSQTNHLPTAVIADQWADKIIQAGAVYA